VVDGNLSEGVTGAGISRSMASFGLNVSADRINNHAKHYAPPEARQPGTRKRDFAILVREKAVEQFEAGELDLTDKDHAPGISAGLKAQALIDKREAGQKKQTQAEAFVALLSALRGEDPVALIEDGLTIEGTFEDLTDAD
jgi:hypothetical protein